MIINLNKFLIYITVVFCLSTETLNAQILRDSTSSNLIKKGIEDIYNFRFEEADKVCETISRLYPNHPIGYLFNGILTYWKNYPLRQSSNERVNYESDMRKCIELCEAKHNSSNEAELLLANLCARGMLLLFYADNDLSNEVIPLATSTYGPIRRSFNFTSIYNDFYFFTGLYNYYREAYPDAYPLYKTFAFLFPKGDKRKGLKELQIASQNSIFLKAESASFLASIYLGFDNDYPEASKYSSYLHNLYPSNIAYLAAYIKSLLLVKQYEEAEKLINIYKPITTSSYFQAQLEIFNGILNEKKYSDPDSAEQDYKNGIKSLSSFGKYGLEYTAYAYFGLSRIYSEKGDRKSSKIFRKKALELADFKKVDFD